MTQIEPETLAERFTRDVTKHQLDVRLDQGIYRHLVFSKPNTNVLMFSLVTTPGRLIYAGDMGCYVFERLYDMFEFFRPTAAEQTPNYDYWHEKLAAGCLRDGSRQPSVSRFRANLGHYLEGEELTAAELKQVLAFIDEAAAEFEEDGPDAAYRSVADFSLDGEGSGNRFMFFRDFWEYSNTEYTFRYLWACHAIPWGIAQYDQFKEHTDVPSVSP
jgi:hypothetical protein